MKMIIEGGPNQYQGYLESQKGKTVRVCVSVEGMYRVDYCTQMAIKGKLEIHEDQCRVLVDDTTYTYFTPNDVYMVTDSEDREPCIYIKIDTNPDMSKGVYDD